MADDKRKKLDPRFRDPNFPHFEDRRKKSDFEVHEEDKKKRRLFKFHPDTKTTITVGITALVVLVILVFAGIIYLKSGGSLNREKLDLWLAPILSR